MPVRFATGDVIYNVGDPLGGVYGIVSGAVTVTTAPLMAVPRLFHVGGPGSWIGEGCFLSRQPRRVGMQAAVETLTMHLPLSAMDQIASENPLAVRYFTQILMMNLDILVRAFYAIQDPDDVRRVAAALCRIAAAPHTPIPLTQAELGLISHTSRKRVNFALGQFEAAGWLTKGYRSIILKDVSALDRFSEPKDDEVARKVIDEQFGRG